MTCCPPCSPPGPICSPPRPSQTLTGGKDRFGPGFEANLADAGIKLLRPARLGEPERAGAQPFKPPDLATGTDTAEETA